MQYVTPTATAVAVLSFIPNMVAAGRTTLSSADKVRHAATQSLHHLCLDLAGLGGGGEACDGEGPAVCVLRLRELVKHDQVHPGVLI